MLFWYQALLLVVQGDTDNVVDCFRRILLLPLKAKDAIEHQRMLIDVVGPRLPWRGPRGCACPFLENGRSSVRQSSVTIAC